MIEYLTDVAPIEEGKTNEEIALYLSSLCNKPLPCGTVVAMCSAAKMVYRDLETEKMAGPLWDALRTSPNPLAQWFLRHVWLDRREQVTLDGSGSDVPGVDSFQVVSGFGKLSKQMGEANQAFNEIRLGMIQAAGGLRHPAGVTADQITEARMAHAALVDESDAVRLRRGYLAEAMDAALAALDDNPNADLQTISDAMTSRLTAVWGS